MHSGPTLVHFLLLLSLLHSLEKFPDLEPDFSSRKLEEKHQIQVWNNK
jgi:hypothetical protein